MDPAKQLREIWPWIPVFRVVAETEHLPTAAARLHVSASALSRTVRLVEDTLGEELFVRTSRRIVLNSAGKRLLESVRRSMTALERSLTDALAHDFSGDYRVSSLGVLTDFFVLPALLEVRATRPKLIPCMTTLSSREANRQLASGLIEVAFYYDATSMPGIVCEKIGTLTNSIYCGRSHPLFGKKRVDSRELAGHEFSVAAIGDRGTPMDGWPVELPRRIGFQILMLSTNLRVSLSGRFVTVLPDVVAAPELAAGRLWRLAPEVVPDTDVHAACREEDAGHGFTSDLIREVAQRIASAARGVPARRAAKKRARR
jgi:DNA-binding transcriptional LysR family regulator